MDTPGKPKPFLHTEKPILVAAIILILGLILVQMGYLTATKSRSASPANQAAAND